MSCSSKLVILKGVVGGTTDFVAKSDISVHALRTQDLPLVSAVRAGWGTAPLNLPDLMLALGSECQN